MADRRCAAVEGDLGHQRALKASTARCVVTKSGLRYFMNTRLRALARAEYFDPEPVLRAMSAIERIVAESETPELIKRLRTGGLKSAREARDALVFAHGMAARCGTKVFVSPGEREDFDFVTRVQIDDRSIFSGVQLKEWPPADLNPNMSFADLALRIGDLPPSDAVLAVHLNRRAIVPVAALNAVRVKFAELWFYWAADESCSQWILHGNVLATPSSSTFVYPR